MSAPLDDAAALVAELLARRWLPRQHPKVRRALIDADLWGALQERLASVGLRLVDNIHADHVAVALLRPAESAVFGEAGLNSHNNIDLPRDAVSLLVVLWSLIILPKRERQAARAAGAESDGQGEMFRSDRPLPKAASVSGAVSYKALLADFGPQLGKKTRMDGNLRRLVNHGFILFRNDEISEGPLLDLLLDYDTLAPRILDGALSDVLAHARHVTAPVAATADGTPAAEPAVDPVAATDADAEADAVADVDPADDTPAPDSLPD